MWLSVYSNSYASRKAYDNKITEDIAELTYKREYQKRTTQVYRADERIVNPILIASKKYPHAILTMDSAFYYYKLTDVIPTKVHLATNRNSDNIKNEKIVQIFMQKNILDYDKTSVIIE